MNKDLIDIIQWVLIFMCLCKIHYLKETSSKYKKILYDDIDWLNQRIIKLEKGEYKMNKEQFELELEQFLNKQIYVVAYKSTKDIAEIFNNKLIEYIKRLQKENQELKENNPMSKLVCDLIKSEEEKVKLEKIRVDALESLKYAENWVYDENIGDEVFRYDINAINNAIKILKGE